MQLWPSPRPVKAEAIHRSSRSPKAGGILRRTLTAPLRAKRRRMLAEEGAEGAPMVSRQDRSRPRAICKRASRPAW